MARQQIMPPSALVRLGGWIRVVHTFPVIAVTASTALLAVLSGGEDREPWRVALLAAAMFFGQVSIGIHNDYLDRQRDAVSKPDKPIPAGLVPAGAAPPAALGAFVAYVILAAPLGPAVVVLGLAALSAGYAYNLWLKHTPAGPLAYLAGFGLLLVWVWVATDALRLELTWVYVFGPPLTAGLHLTNAVPDLAGDRAAGVRNLATVLGWPGAALTAWGLAFLADVLLGVGGLIFDVDPAQLLVLLAGALVLSAGGLALSLAGRTHWAAFRGYAALAALLLLGWVVIA